MNAAWPKFRALSLLTVLAFAGCAFGANQDPLPGAVYNDPSTPKNLPETNGGIIADVTLNGRGYNVVTDRVASAVHGWQKSYLGFRRVKYAGNELWAIDKGVMFKFDTSP